jgi:uncharacterized protein (TIGR02246 family)
MIERPLLALLTLASVGFVAQVGEAAGASAEEDAIRQTADAFVAAFNDGDADAVAALWTEDGEYFIGSNAVKGRPAIAKLYEEFFRANPGSKMTVKVDSVRMLAPTVALEQGSATVKSESNDSSSASSYSAVHVKQGQKWLMASVRELDAPMSTNNEPLQEIAWLVGDWAARGDVAKVEVKYDWMVNKRFLRGETVVRSNDGTDELPAGVQIIGRDPLTGQIVSWFFDADGGHGYGVWTSDGSRWLIQTQGATSDGAPTTATNLIDLVNDGVLSWQSANRTVGDQTLPDSKEIVIERVQTKN